MPGNYVHYIEQARAKPRKVWFTGSTALIWGQGLCYDRDYTGSETGAGATDPCGNRDKYVELPDTSNNNWFAGVTMQAYSAVTGGHWVEIYEPGSVCEVAIAQDVVLDTGFYTCSCGGGDVGLFSRPGLPGRGSMIPLETNASGALVRVANGTGSITTATLTDAGALGDVEAGDYCYLVGGGVTATGIADATGIYGKYICATDVATNTTVLSAATTANGHDNATSAAPNFTSATAVDYVIMSGQQRVLAYLQDGPESGLQQYLNLTQNATVDAMAGGTTYLSGGGQTAANIQDIDVVTQPGILFKRFVCEGGTASTPQTITNDAGVTLLQMDGTTYTTLTVAAAADHALFMFDPLGITAKTIMTDMTEA